MIRRFSLRSLGLVRLSRVALVAGVFAQLTACPGSIADPGAFADSGAHHAEATTGGNDCTEVVDQMFAQTCSVSSCHTTSMPAAGIDLQSPNVLKRLKGVEAPDAGGFLIAPNGSSAESVLYEVLLSNDPPGGSRMPLGEAAESAATLACVASWIASIAPDGGVRDGGPTPDGSGTDAQGIDAPASDATTADSGSDAGTHDATTPADTGTKDASVHDTGSDTGAHDAGAKDAASADGGHADGGHAEDGGHDGGHD